MSRLNWSGVFFAISAFTAGYCFGGRIGLGIAAVIVALVQMR